MRDLHNNQGIIIKPADKGGSIVIMNTTNYIQEAQRQLSNPQHYRILNTDPTATYNKYIHQIIDQAWRLGIIGGTTKENLQTKNPKISSFYILPKMHKPNNPGRPIVNSFGLITEKISAFVDEHLRNLHLEYQAMWRTLLTLSTLWETFNWTQRTYLSQLMLVPYILIYPTLKALQPLIKWWKKQGLTLYWKCSSPI